MSILIKEIKMPKDGVYWCEIGVAGDIAVITIHGEDRKSFNLVPVPPHGDLIDAYEQMKLMQAYEYDTYDDYKRAFDMLDNAQTIIPAERREEEFDGDTWHDLNGATAAPSGMKWQSNGKSRFSGGYMHRLVKKDTGDAVPVVRCKDCKHRDVGNGLCEGRGWPTQLVPDDGFCDKGERSEE